MCLCVMMLIKAVLPENFLQRPYLVYPDLRCCFSCLSVVQGQGTVTMVNFFVLVCLGQHAQLFGQTQCYCGREAFEDATNIEPDDLVLCRWASTSLLKPWQWGVGGVGGSFPRQQTFRLQNASGLWDQLFPGSACYFPCGSQACQLPGLQKPTPLSPRPELCNNSL